MKCPLCQSDSKFAFEAKGFALQDCLTCGHRFTEVKSQNHIAEVYDDTYFHGGGAGYNDYLGEGEMLIQRGIWYARLLEKYLSAGKMLDVGCSAGFILKGFTEKGWQGVGLEPNANMAGYGRKNLTLNIMEGDLENLEIEEKFDLISMIQVVAHFHQPQKAFEKSAELLAPKGFLLVETWNRNSLSAKLFGQNWHEYSPPSVLQWFSLKGLSKFLETFGFEKVANGRPSKKISGKHAKSLLKYRLGNKFWLDFIPDRLNFPYPSEDLFWALYRKK